MKWILALAGLMSGAALAAQVGMNNTLRARMGHPMTAAFTSFSVGTAALALYLLAVRPVMPDRSNLTSGPWWMWIGGLVGAVYVASAAAFAARLGAAAWLGLIVTGQIAASMVMDHFGLVGFPRRPINAAKLVGAALLLAGVVIVLRSSSDASRSDTAKAQSLDR